MTSVQHVERQGANTANAANIANTANTSIRVSFTIRSCAWRFPSSFFTPIPISCTFQDHIREVTPYGAARVGYHRCQRLAWSNTRTVSSCTCVQRLWLAELQDPATNLPILPNLDPGGLHCFMQGMANRSAQDYGPAALFLKTGSPSRFHYRSAAFFCRLQEMSRLDTVPAKRA